MPNVLAFDIKCLLHAEHHMLWNGILVNYDNELAQKGMLQLGNSLLKRHDLCVF